MASYDAPIFDCDTHFYESDDLWERVVPAKHRDRWAVAMRTGSDGQFALYVGDRRVEISAGHLRADGTVPAPGRLHEWLRAQKAGKDQIEFFVPPTPDMLEPEPRVRKMDAFGVDSCLTFPGNFLSCISYFDDTQVAYDVFHAYNEWIRDRWSYNYKDRIFTTPLLDLRDVDAAVKEAEWVVRNGARVVIMPMGPVNNRAPAHPDHDRFWAVLNEAHVRVTYHVSEADYMKTHMAVWGEKTQQSRLWQTAFIWMHGYSERPLVETLSSFIFHNFFARFPNIKLISAENGAEWVPAMLIKMDKVRGIAKNGYWPCGQLPERPSVIFKKNIFVVAYPEDDLETIINGSRGHDFLLMGSDYPHSEGVPTPQHFYTEACGKLSPQQTLAVMHDNALRLMQN